MLRRPICPAGGDYQFSVAENQPVTGLDFGNVCVGGGGGHTKGYWTNKHGQATFADDSAGAEAMLQGLHLRNEDGSDFDPTSYADYKSWLKSARATNAANMLSAQLSALALNVHFGFVDADQYIQAAGSSSANAAGFATVQDIIVEADAALDANGTTVGDDPNRAKQLLLSAIIDAANNDGSFVQPTAEDCRAPFFGLAFSDDFNAENGGAAALNYAGFANWTVGDGTVDLIGEDSAHDFYPGNGLYVDLDGSSGDAGVLTSSDQFALLAGGTYELRFDLGGSARSESPTDTVDVALGTVFAESFTLDWDDPLTTVVRDINVTTSELATLSFADLGNDNRGLILDNVQLVRLP